MAEKKVESITVVDNSLHVGEQIKENMKRAAVMLGGSLEGHAKEYCPVDTGLLRNSITYAIGGENAHNMTYKNDGVDKKGNSVKVIGGVYLEPAPADEEGKVTIYVGSNVNYAPFQELGAPSINLPAKPYLRPAFENHREELSQIVSSCFSNMRKD